MSSDILGVSGRPRDDPEGAAPANFSPSATTFRKAVSHLGHPCGGGAWEANSEYSVVKSPRPSVSLLPAINSFLCFLRLLAANKSLSIRAHPWLTPPDISAH
jgi:hypothetical protein